MTAFMDDARARVGRARRRSFFSGFVLLWLALLAMPQTAVSETKRLEEVDTEHMFGFTEGSEIGERGETELMSETTGHFGRSGGSYIQVASLVEAKHTFTDRFRVSASATLGYYNISGVLGLDDHHGASVQSLSFSARYRFLDHQDAPFALTLSIESGRGFADETSGARADQIGATFAALADRELLPGRLFGALNLIYEPERSRLHGVGEISRQAMLGAGVGLTTVTAFGIYAGFEVRYLRQYEAVPLSHFAGQAIYTGPTLYAHLGDHALISAAWNAAHGGS